MTIANVPSSIKVTKTATPTSLQEPGGNATFAVSVKNTSAVDSVTITTLTDDIYGNLDGKGTCDVPQTLAPGATYECSFTGAVSGAAGSTHKDVVTASGTDDDGGELSGSDDATVTITAGRRRPRRRRRRRPAGGRGGAGPRSTSRSRRPIVPTRCSSARGSPTR